MRQFISRECHFCCDAVACVVDSVPVGVDVESLDAFDEQLVAAVMNDEEQRQIRHSADPRIAFARLWTMKESLLKMSGEGLADDMRTVLCDPQCLGRCMFQTTVYPRFVCTVCTRRD